jgi:hypothetical protein
VLLLLLLLLLLLRHWALCGCSCVSARSPAAEQRPPQSSPGCAMFWLSFVVSSVQYGVLQL